MNTESTEVKTSRFFKITGGIYPGRYRSTSIEVFSDDVEQCYTTIKQWAAINFPDWNHIGEDNSIKHPFYRMNVSFITSQSARNKFKSLRK